MFVSRAYFRLWWFAAPSAARLSPVTTEKSADDLRLVVLGARGSIPVSGAEFLAYGGSTTSFAVADGSIVRAFIDAGTGLISFNSHKLELSGSVPVFLTHYHWDHIQGVSMLSEVWAGACLFTFYGPEDPEPMLTRSITPPWFPVALGEAPEPVAFRSLDGPVVAPGMTVTSFPIQHPQGAVGYKVDGPNRSVAIVTDHESSPDSDEVIAKAIDGVDVLIHDAQYLPSEVDSHIGWGHSTWVNAVAMAKRVGATELVLTSHAPSRSDSDIDAMVSDAVAEFPNTVAAGPGMVVSL
jgi:ribonuclease BN (tRNA processing enzyme)